MCYTASSHLLESKGVPAASNSGFGRKHRQVIIAENACHGAADEVCVLAGLQHQHLVVRTDAIEVVARLRQLTLRVPQVPLGIFDVATAQGAMGDGRHAASGRLWVSITVRTYTSRCSEKQEPRVGSSLAFGCGLPGHNRIVYPLPAHGLVLAA